MKKAKPKPKPRPRPEQKKKTKTTTRVTPGRAGSSDDSFEDIAADTIALAESADVSFEEFVEGLRLISGEVAARLEMAEAELEARKGQPTAASEE